MSEPELPLFALLAAATGLWLLVEGLAYGLFPDQMRRLLDWAARLPLSELRSAGLWTAALGAICLYLALRVI